MSEKAKQTHITKETRDTLFKVMDQMFELDPDGVREWIVNTFPDYKDLYE